MSNTTQQNLKKHVGTQNDKIFLKPLRLSCPFGKKPRLGEKPGPKKIYKNLWCFQYHLKKYHFDSDDNKRKSIRYIEMIYELISQGVLR